MNIVEGDRRLANPESMLGQLQRGRGEGYLAASDMAQTEAKDLLMSCIVDDPRWDSQAEFRSFYCASSAKKLDYIFKNSALN